MPINQTASELVVQFDLSSWKVNIVLWILTKLCKQLQNHFNIFNALPFKKVATSKCEIRLKKGFVNYFKRTVWKGLHST